jgi:cytochrome c553
MTDHGAVIFALLMSASLAAQIPARAAQPPGWAFFVPADDAASLLPPAVRAQTQDPMNPPDWYPDEHPPMPAIVARGSPPQDTGAPPSMPCALCHLPNGAGHVESASLAGLSLEYMIGQMADFRSGARSINVGNAGAARFLTALKRTYTGDQVRAAAGYFASLQPTNWIRVRETNRVPRSVVNPATLMRVRIPGAGSEPLGNRIIELAEDDSKLINRDAHSGYIAKGKALAAGVGSVACAACHGPTLTGLDGAPPLAGRPPTYLVRQLWNFKNGVRRGSLGAPMQAVAASMNTGQMLALGAYLASLPPAATPGAR